MGAFGQHPGKELDDKAVDVGDFLFRYTCQIPGCPGFLVAAAAAADMVFCN